MYKNGCIIRHRYSNDEFNITMEEDTRCSYMEMRIIYCNKLVYKHCLHFLPDKEIPLHVTAVFEAGSWEFALEELSQAVVRLAREEEIRAGR